MGCLVNEMESFGGEGESVGETVEVGKDEEYIAGMVFSLQLSLIGMLSVCVWMDCDRLSDLNRCI